MLAENWDYHLTPKQVQFGQQIHQAGNKLLALVNDLLDLAQIGGYVPFLEVDEVDISAIAISKELASPMNEHLEVVSEAGKGSTFTLDAQHRLTNPLTCMLTLKKKATLILGQRLWNLFLLSSVSPIPAAPCPCFPAHVPTRLVTGSHPQSARVFSGIRG